MLMAQMRERLYVGCHQSAHILWTGSSIEDFTRVRIYDSQYSLSADEVSVGPGYRIAVFLAVSAMICAVKREDL